MSWMCSSRCAGCLKSGTVLTASPNPLKVGDLLPFRGQHSTTDHIRVQSQLYAAEGSRAKKQLFVTDHRAGCFRIEARACSRVESAALFAVAAPFSNDGARLLRLARSFCFRCELSAAQMPVSQSSMLNYYSIKRPILNPVKYSEGIRFVLVNGASVVKDGQLQVGVNPGQAMRAPLQ
jgi:hypothetical protein